MFDAKQHLIQLPRRVKDPRSGSFTTRFDDYLEVRWRAYWFREEYPHGSIITEEICVDLDRGYARYKATVGDGEGGIATGTGTETRKSFEDFVEKTETRAIGRALALLGFGTQFCLEELSEGEHVADAPVAPQSAVTEAPSNGDSPAQEPAHDSISKDAIDQLWQVAFQGCHEAKDAFASRIRQLMRLPGSQLISKAYLQRTMTVEQYRAALAYYEAQLKAQIEEDVPNHTPQRTATALPLYSQTRQVLVLSPRRRQPNNTTRP
jgi:hypothetical protein